MRQSQSHWVVKKLKTLGPFGRIGAGERTGGDV